MTITKIKEIQFDNSDTILTGTLTDSNKFVMLLSTGDVVSYSLDTNKTESLFSVKSFIQYSDGGFDLTAKSTIYTLDEIIVIVNDFKTHGIIHYPGKYDVLRLMREDYHADISCYPISLFKNTSGVPHLIYGVAWNHVQIMNLETRQVLTATKSLIEENAEQRHIEFYKEHTEDNKLSWPRSYDYFFGKLYLSPDKKKFLSAGWIWGSSDYYTVYDIDDFINNSRIRYLEVGCWEHSGRSASWISDDSLVIPYSDFAEDNDGATAETPHELHFYKMADNKIKLEKKITVPQLKIFSADLTYSKENNCLVAFSDEIGLALIDLNGQVLHSDKDIKVNRFDSFTNLLTKVDDKSVTIYRLK